MFYCHFIIKDYSTESLETSQNLLLFDGGQLFGGVLFVFTGGWFNCYGFFHIMAFFCKLTSYSF